MTSLAALQSDCKTRRGRWVKAVDEHGERCRLWVAAGEEPPPYDFSGLSWEEVAAIIAALDKWVVEDEVAEEVARLEFFNSFESVPMVIRLADHRDEIRQSRVFGSQTCGPPRPKTANAQSQAGRSSRLRKFVVVPPDEFKSFPKIFQRAFSASAPARPRRGRLRARDPP